METILAELVKEQAVSVAHLCQMTGASEATIHRDLNELARRGKPTAAPCPSERDSGGEGLNMDVKRQLHTPEKMRIARYAAEPGFTTPDPEEAMVKAAAARARETWVLADSSKFGASTAASVLPLSGARIVTDRLDDRRYLEYTGIKVV